MKAKPLKFIGDGKGYEPCTPAEATHVKINIPGPCGKFTLPVMIGGTRAGTGNWTWNGDTEKPTFKPSVLITSGHFVDGHKPEEACWCKYWKEHPEEKQVFICYRCHSWINDGKVQFLGDCTHELVNKTVELLEVIE